MKKLIQTLAAGGLVLGTLLAFSGATAQVASAGAPFSCTATAGAPPNQNTNCQFGNDTNFTGFGSPNHGEVDNNVWSGFGGSCTGTQKVKANSLEDWQATANFTAGQTVCTYPNAWAHDPSGTIDQYSKEVSAFTESFPHNSSTAAHFMWDLWFNNWQNEVMIQVDFSDDAPCGGAWPQVETNLSFGGNYSVPTQGWHLCENYGSAGDNTGQGAATADFKLGNDDSTEQSESTGKIDFGQMLKYLENTVDPNSSNGSTFLPANSTWTAWSAGFEIGNTGGVNEHFTVSNLTSTIQ